MPAPDTYPIVMPPRWVVRKGAACLGSSLARQYGGQPGVHQFMESIFAPHPRCGWCDISWPAHLQTQGWTVTNPATGSTFLFADHATAVRHASARWHDSLDPWQRHYQMMRRTTRVLLGAGLLT